MKLRLLLHGGSGYFFSPWQPRRPPSFCFISKLAARRIIWLQTCSVKIPIARPREIWHQFWTIFLTINIFNIPLPPPRCHRLAGKFFFGIFPNSDGRHVKDDMWSSRCRHKMIQDYISSRRKMAKSRLTHCGALGTKILFNIFIVKRILIIKQIKKYLYAQHIELWSKTISRAIARWQKVV